MSAAVAGQPNRVARRLMPRAMRGNDRGLVVAAVVCGLIVLIAIVGPAIAPHDPDATDILNQSLSPSSAHLLGTDSLGRDIFSRILDGARASLLGPAYVALLAGILGTATAIACAWIGGRFDAVMSRVLDVLFAFPSLLLAVLAVAMFGSGMVAPVVALSIGYMPYIARVVKSVALRERHMAYIDSCRMMGYSGWRICFRHLLPNVRGMITAQATLLFASALVDLAAISFLGLGAQSPSSQWGLMVQDGSNELLNGAAQQSLAAGGAIVVTVVAFNVLGDRLTTRSVTRSR